MIKTGELRNKQKITSPKTAYRVFQSEPLGSGRWERISVCSACVVVRVPRDEGRANDETSEDSQDKNQNLASRKCTLRPRGHLLQLYPPRRPDLMAWNPILFIGLRFSPYL